MSAAKQCAERTTANQHTRSLREFPTAQRRVKTFPFRRSSLIRFRATAPAAQQRRHGPKSDRLSQLGIFRGHMWPVPALHSRLLRRQFGLSMLHSAEKFIYIFVYVSELRVLIKEVEKRHALVAPPIPFGACTFRLTHFKKVLRDFSGCTFSCWRGKRDLSQQRGRLAPIMQKQNLIWSLARLGTKRRWQCPNRLSFCFFSPLARWNLQQASAPKNATCHFVYYFAAVGRLRVSLAAVAALFMRHPKLLVLALRTEFDVRRWWRADALLVCYWRGHCVLRF